jgi:hypothetical protein
MNEKVPREQLLSIKELAFTLRRSQNYIFAMKRHGFKMPGHQATLRAALAWLARNPPPRSRLKWKT